ncbi:MAG: glycerophosphodiester phosphodiesterase family protein [Aeromicrobium sp.]
MTDTKRKPTGRIFISYRRQDSAYPAGWLFDHLAERFGPEQVFKDVDSIELGDDFVEVITNAVVSCDVLLALIGRKWLRAGGPGGRRLDDPNDFVRIEIEVALERGVLLIPILVDGATMPRSDQLPPSIAPLTRHQALELSPNRFRADTSHLLDVMERTLIDLREEQPLPAEVSAAAPPEIPVTDPRSPEPPPERPRRSFRSRPVLLGGAFAAVVAIAALALGIINALSDDPRRPAASPTTAKSLTTTPAPLGRPNGPMVLAHRGGDETYAWQTLPAFEDAATRGAGVETDVRWTSDGVAVLLHDADTSPGMECTGGSHVVEDTAWPVLRDKCRSAAAASKDGKRYAIPTFGDAVSALAKIPGAQIYPEVKVVQSARQVRQFMGILENVRMTDRAVVTSTKLDELDKIRAQAEKDGVDVRTMLFISGRRPATSDIAGHELWGAAVEVDLATKEYVKELKDNGMKVLVWIVNTPEQWALADEVGADLVLTSRPAGYGAWADVN